MIRHLDLFSGIGGFSRAVQWCGGETVAFVEWDAWCRRVCAKHWPEARFFGDIRSVTADDLRGLGRVDLITGGYPCQPFSLAGQRLGAEDDRHLWPEMRRVIDLCRPRFILAENVAGHITMGLDTVLAELEEDGYTCGAIVVPACAVNALHRRDRVWIMAHAGREAGNLGDRLPQGEQAQQRRRRSPDHGGETGIPNAGESRWGARQRDLLPGQSNALGSGSELADAAARGIRRGGASGDERQPALSGQDVSHPEAYLRRASGNDRPESLDRGSEPRKAGQASRPLDARADELPAGLVRRPATGPTEPDLIRAAWADGSWEHDLPRVVADEPERRQKLQAAGNAIVPQVAYAILRVMLGLEHES